MKRILLVITLILVSVVSVSFAQELTGEDIINKAFNRDDGADSYSTMEMYLVDKKKNSRKRVLDVYTKDYGELLKSFIEFKEPADIAGTKFLSIENKKKNDTQYLYLPELGRARRIVSSQKKLSFVNTDYTYEDMKRRRPEKDNNTLLRTEACGQYECYVVESIPKKKNNSQYTKRMNWIGKDNFLVLRTDFYNKKGKKVKEFFVEKLGKRQGYWTVLESVMSDLKDKHMTMLKLIDVKYDQGLENEMFKSSSLGK